MASDATIAQSRTSWPAVLVIYGSGVLAAAQIGKLTPLGAAIRGDLGLSLAGFGAAISIVQMLSIVLGVGGGLLAQRYGARRLLVAGLAVCRLGSLAMGWILHSATRPGRYALAVPLISALAVGPIWSAGLPDAALLALIALAMVTQGMIAALCFASLPRAVGELRLLALGNGLIVQMGSLGATIGPPAFGTLATALGWPGAGLFLTGGLIICGLLVFAAINPLPNPSPASGRGAQ